MAQKLMKQTLAIAEVMTHTSVGDAHSPGYASNGHRGDSALGEEIGRRLQDLVPRFLGCPTSSRHAAHFTLTLQGITLL